jgi:hypothetical protein
MSKPNMIRTLIFALMALAMLLSASAVAGGIGQDDSMRSRGMSTPDIEIIVKQKPSGNLIITRTDVNGEFFFKIVEPGVYVLQLFREGDLLTGAAQARNYNGSKSITTNHWTKQNTDDARVEVSGGLTWYSFEGWPYKFYVLGAGLEMGKPVITEEGLAINKRGVQKTKVVSFVEMRFAIEGQAVNAASGTVIRGRVLMQQGRGGQ